MKCACKPRYRPHITSLMSLRYSQPCLVLTLTKNVSCQNKGASSPPFCFSVVWSIFNVLMNINSLELRSVFVSLLGLQEYVLDQTILIQPDSALVVSYISCKGGSHSDTRPNYCCSALNFGSAVEHISLGLSCGRPPVLMLFSPLRKKSEWTLKR